MATAKMLSNGPCFPAETSSKRGCQCSQAIRTRCRRYWPDTWVPPKLTNVQRPDWNAYGLAGDAHVPLRTVTAQRLQKSMPIKLKEENNGQILDVEVSGKLLHEDLKGFVQRFDQLVKQHGQIRVLCDLVSFDGWDASALWDEIKWDVRHFSDIARLAVVGAKKWEEQLSLFCGPLTTAEIRYFDQIRVGEARTWLESHLSGQRTVAVEKMLF